MSAPVFAAAQCAVRAGDISANLKLHMEFMQHARKEGVGLLLFPELSLTGYEPTLAEALAQDIDSPLLSPLRDLALEASMTTVVGLPLRLPSHDKPVIAASYSTGMVRLVSIPSNIYTLAKSNILVRVMGAI